MSDPVTKRLYDELSGDPTIASLISTFMGFPSVFTAEPAPEKADFPYLIVRASEQNSRADTIDTSMKFLARSIVCFADADGDVSLVDDIALRVETMFANPHGERFANMDGWYAILVDTDGPVDASPDEKTYGRSVEITITMEKF